MELSRETILRTLEEHRPELQRLGVQRLGLFGSYLHGRARAGSDVDLLVRFDRPPTSPTSARRSSGCPPS